MSRNKVNGAPAAEETPAPVVEQALEKIEDGGELTTTISDAMFLEDAGTNDFGKEDLAIPFIRVLQDKSPQVLKRDPKYVEGAEAGMLYNTVTQQVWPGDAGVIAIPVAFTPSFTEWKPNRGGFVKDHGANAAIMDQTTKGGKDGKEDVLSNGNTISRAGLYYLFLFDPATGSVTEALFSLSSTGLTISRKWNSNIRNLRIPRDRNNPKAGVVEPAMYYMSYRISTFLDKREAGDFFSYEIKPFKPTVELGPSGPQIYLAAREFKKMITQGAVTVKHEQAGDTPDDKDVPF